MDTRHTLAHSTPDATTVALAGLAGGAAEVAWVGLHALATGTPAAPIAEQITASLLPLSAVGAAAVPIGLLIHFSLALAVGAAFCALVHPIASRYGRDVVLASALAALAAIWTFNFFVLLPVLNPTFVGLLPLPVTLASKLGFAIAMAAVLSRTPSPATTRTASGTRTA